MVSQLFKEVVYDLKHENLNPFFLQYIPEDMVYGRGYLT